VVNSMDASKKETKESREDLEGLYDLAIPLSTPISVIGELVEKFDLDLVKRKAKVDMTGEVMDREILVLRGDLDTIMAAKEYMFQAIDRKLEEWEEREKEKTEKYRKYREEQAKERIKEAKNSKPQNWTDFSQNL
jgi:hypothetical protein